MKDGQRYIYIAELIRVFGEPREPVGITEDTDKVHASQTIDASSGGLEAMSELIKELRERAERAELQAERERERAERHESELSDARKRIDELTNGMLMSVSQLIEHKAEKPRKFL